MVGIVRIDKDAVEPLVNIDEMNMKNTIEQSVKVKESDIGVVAYHLWEKAGHPTGRDLQFWLDAERQLRTTTKTVSVKLVAPLSALASDNKTVLEAPSRQLAPSRANAAKAQRKGRRF